MNKMYTAAYSKNFLLDNKYTVLFFIKKGCNAETYHVKGKDGKSYFLKSFNVTQVHHSAFDAEGNLLEIVQLIPENELPKEKKQSKLFMYGKYETK